MKTKIVKSLIILLFLPIITNAQLDSATIDSLVRTHIYNYDSIGLFVFKPNSLQFGQLFTIYKSFFMDDSLNEMRLISNRVDHLITQTHKKYQQYNQGYKVEAGQFVEHGVVIPNGHPGFPPTSSLVAANGKIGIITERVDTNLIINKEAAMESIRDSMGWDTLDYHWTHEDPDWEQELKDSTGVPDTSYHPLSHATLVWAVWNYEILGPYIPQNQLRLAWRIEFFCLEPNFHQAYYADAYTGELFKMSELEKTDGPATILHYSGIVGDLVIDTRSRGWPYNDHVLKATGGGKKIQTKYYYGQANTSGSSNPNGTAFSLSPEVDDNDDQWGTSEQRATTSHWLVSKAWEYFADVHAHPGTKGNSNKIKVRADGPHLDNATKYSPSDVIQISSTHDDGIFLGQLDVIAHEYGHGVVRHLPNLEYNKESGALDESFADIFGTMTERHTENQMSLTWDWTIAEDATATWVLRDLASPHSAGTHYTCTSCVPCNSFVGTGQPDTYKGQWWYYGKCDDGGVHVNSGVQNRWFSLLVDGGIHNGDTVTGIGADDAEDIAFFMLDLMTDHSQYMDARSLSTFAAWQLFGMCSQHHHTVVDAWDAVMVPGSPIFCGPLDVAELEAIKADFKVFPNPASGHFNLEFSTSAERTIEVVDLSGKLVFTTTLTASQQRVQVYHLLANGYYIVRVLNQTGSASKPLIINR